MSSDISAIFLAAATGAHAAVATSYTSVRTAAHATMPGAAPALILNGGSIFRRSRNACKSKNRANTCNE